MVYGQKLRHNFYWLPRLKLISNNKAPLIFVTSKVHKIRNSFGKLTTQVIQKVPDLVMYPYV